MIFGPQYLIDPVQRLLSLILLLCFGVTSLQGMPFRLCLLDNKVIPPGITASSPSGHSHGESNECCGACETGQWGQHRSDCCVDVDQQAKSTAPTAPRTAEQLAALELPVTILLTLDWIGLFRPIVADRIDPLTREHYVPLAGSDRQAVLSIWTV